MTTTGSDAQIQTVLLIDDERIDQMLYRRVLERSGLVGEIIGHRYADEALEFLSQPDRPRIDIILLDINMPRMNGFEFLDAATERLGADFVRAIVIMLSTSIADSDQQRAAQFAAVKGYITKPLTVDDVHRMAAMLNDGMPL